jgi:hypothetical protein
MSGRSHAGSRGPLPTSLTAAMPVSAGERSHLRSRLDNADRWAAGWSPRVRLPAPTMEQVRVRPGQLSGGGISAINTVGDRLIVAAELMGVRDSPFWGPSAAHQTPGESERPPTKPFTTLYGPERAVWTVSQSSAFPLARRWWAPWDSNPQPAD